MRSIADRPQGPARVCVSAVAVSTQRRLFRARRFTLAGLPIVGSRTDEGPDAAYSVPIPAEPQPGNLRPSRCRGQIVN